MASTAMPPVFPGPRQSLPDRAPFPRHTMSAVMCLPKQSHRFDVTRGRETHCLQRQHHRHCCCLQAHQSRSEPSQYPGKPCWHGIGGRRAVQDAMQDSFLTTRHRQSTGVIAPEPHCCCCCLQRRRSRCCCCLQWSTHSVSSGLQSFQATSTLGTSGWRGSNIRV